MIELVGGGRFKPFSTSFTPFGFRLFDTGEKKRSDEMRTEDEVQLLFSSFAEEAFQLSFRSATQNNFGGIADKLSALNVGHTAKRICEKFMELLMKDLNDALEIRFPELLRRIGKADQAD